MTDSNVETIETLVGFAEKARANTLAAEHLEQVLITRATHYDDDTIEHADAYQAHNDPVDPGSDDIAGALDDDADEENDTFSSDVALDDVPVVEAGELDELALLADTWNNDIDPEVSAQLVQNQCTSLHFFQKGEKKR